MSEINSTEVIIQPIVPKAVDNQQVIVYIPTANTGSYGVIKLETDNLNPDVVAENGILQLRNGRVLQTKVDVVEVPECVYATPNTFIPYTEFASENTIVYRNKDGNFNSGDAKLDSNVVNLRVLKQEIGKAFIEYDALNIKNGEGQYSVIQKVAPSTTTDPNNYSKGKEAVTLGRYNKTYGDRSMTVNYDNENYGMWSFVANTKNKNGSKDVPQENVQSNAMFGCANEIKVGIEGFVAGKSNVNYEGDRFNISGSENENHTNNVRISGRKNKSLKEIKTPITSGGGGGGSTNPDTNPTEPTQPFDYTSGTGYADISGTENEVFAMGGKASGVAGICYSPFGSTEGFWTKAGHLVEDTTKSTETEKYYKPQGLGAKAFGRATHAKEDFTVAGGEQSVALKKGANAIGYYTTANTEWGTAIGKYNVGKTNSLFEVGNGYAVFDAGRKNAFEVLVDGRAKVQTAPQDNDDVVRKLELDRKFDKAGGTVTGDMVVGGNFTVQGKTTTVDSETLRVSDKLIEVGKGNTTPLTSPAGLITPKYDGTNNGGIVYDHTGTAYVGDISLDSNGNVDVNNSDLQPIATRNAAITDGNIVEWNNTNKTLVDSGKAVDNLSTATNLENGTALDSLVQKYSGEVDATHFGNTCDGESGAVFGEANFNSGNRTLISGKMNRSSAPNSLIIGLGNGRGIDADPTIDVLSGEQLFVFGALNSVSNGNGNVVLGAENTLSDVRYTTIIGRGNIIDNTSLYEGKCVVGRFNNQKPDTMFEVGVGDYNNRVNGFEVLKDGRAKVQAAPQDNDDVVRKLELDNVNARYVSTSILGG